MSKIADIYVKLIRAGIRDLPSVPEVIRADVEAALTSEEAAA